ncbi:hemicentin-1-like [Lates japonicus]|uniref:Hemicentin-1-like protein n=1 Tax=Lates japonicus TaxID=270547 RepID=A0AAD3RAC2_LATJO|nr:hemicentin-1-like protein [Lates japonicus]
MTSFRCVEFLLFLLFLLHQIYGEEPEPVFRAQGSSIEMGYCFGTDYIVVYRSTLEGDQLLGNCSANNSSISPPADLQGRVQSTTRNDLLGLAITNLSHMDSGIYRRECWQNHTLVKQLIQRLFVCDEEVEAMEIIVREDAEAAELLCNSTSTGLEGTSVRWYYEMFPSYMLTLFLDSSVSLEPLTEELQGIVEVKDKGALLVLDKSVLKNIQHFHCLVVKGKNCLSFQNIYLPEHTESRDIYASRGDRVVLNCPSDGNKQEWDTPQGKFNGDSRRISEMYISFGDKSEDFSLVIPSVTDDHSGDYSCISTSLELQYFLVLCPKKNPQEKFDIVGGNVLLECKVGQDDSQKVQWWYRRQTTGEPELIHDPNDETVPIPQDLRGRLTLSDNGSSLTISNVKMTDAGLYWCVVLRDPKFVEGDDDYSYDYNEEDTEDDESDYSQWPDTNQCIFKQDITLTLRRTRIGVDQKPVTYEPGDRNSGISPTADAPTTSNSTAYAVVAVVLGLLVVGAIAAGIVIKRKKATSRSGLNMNKDIKMNEDPGCTVRLTNDECAT